jgi:hypothetical protein
MRFEAVIAVSVGTTIFCDVTSVACHMGANVSCSQPPIQWVPGALSLGVNHPRREANYFLESRVQIKNERSCKFIPRDVFMMWCLIKCRRKFTFIFYWVSFSGVKGQAHEADFSRWPSVKLKSSWSDTPYFPIPLHEAWCLIKHRKNHPLHNNSLFNTDELQA